MDISTIAIIVLDVCLVIVGAVLIPTLLKTQRTLDDISEQVRTFSGSLAHIEKILQDSRLTDEQIRGEIKGLQREIEFLKERNRN